MGNRSVAEGKKRQGPTRRTSAHSVRTPRRQPGLPQADPFNSAQSRVGESAYFFSRTGIWYSQ